MSLKLIVIFIVLKLCIAKKTFTIVIDTTESMTEEINIIKVNLPSVLSGNVSEIENFILLPFKDSHISSPYFYTTPQSLLQALNSYKASGGSDCPENSMAAIEKALEASDQESTIFVFTDASAKNAGNINLLNSIIELCVSKRSQVVILLSGTCAKSSGIISDASDIEVYYEIAKFCSGNLFRFDTKDLRHSFKFMQEVSKEDWNQIVTHETFTDNKEFNMKLDTFTTNFVISVSGIYPLLQISTDDDWTPPIQKIIETRRALVVRVLNPRIGNYKIIVRCHGAASVVFYIKNNLPFKFGFSTLQPKTLRETALRPLPGETNFILLSVNALSVKLNSLSIIIDNKVTQYHLDEIDIRKGIYLAKAFFVAGESFKMSILGQDLNNNKEVTGMTKTLEPQKTATIVIHTHNTKPSIEIIEPETSLLNYNSNELIPCKVEGLPKPNIWWEDENGNHLKSQDALLTAPSVYISYVEIEKFSRNLTIFCKAANELGEASKSLNLYVNRPVSFDIIRAPEDTSIEYGQDGVLYCEISAYPEAKIVWYHNDTEIDTFTSNVEIEGNSLILKKVSLMDAGEYICAADNGVENRRLSAEVEVSGLEIPVISLSEHELIAKPGSNQKVYCSIDKGNPQPTLKWLFKLSNDNNKFENLPEDVIADDGKLILSDLKIEHSGVYRCVARNFLGEAYEDVEIKIQFQPEITQDTQLVTVKEGEDVALPCEVNAIPPAEIKWKKEGSQDDITDQSHVIDEHNTYRFTAFSKDSGRYVCKAENELGSAERVVDVNVLVAPYINTPPLKAITLRAGQSVELQCDVIYGNPEPETKWDFTSADSTVVTLQRGNYRNTLSLQNVSKQKEGKYLCIAENLIGIDTISIQLTVV